MTPKQFVAIQMAKRFTAREIPDRKHVQYCRKHTCRHLSLGYEAAHAGAAFHADWFFESYHRFRDRPSRYYANAVIPWSAILEHG